MIDLNSVRQLVDRMQNVMSSKKDTTINNREAVERAVDEISLELEEVVLQIKRCVVWIESGRFVEASALSEDCGNLVLISDFLNSETALPAWRQYCQSEKYPDPPQINDEDIQTINNGTAWEGQIEQLSNAWIESNLLLQNAETKWVNIHNLVDQDSHNKIWELQEKQIAAEVLPILRKGFDEATKLQNLSKMKSAFHSLTKLPLKKECKSEEKRMQSIIQTVEGLISSRNMLAIADDLSLAEANADLVAQRSLIEKWDEFVSNGGVCTEKQVQIDEVKRTLEEEDREKEKDINLREKISHLERILDENGDVHEIEKLYSRIDNLGYGNIPAGLKEMVREKIKESKSLRRRKTRTIIFTTSVVLVVSLAYLGHNIFQQYQEDKIVTLVDKGNRCLDNYDFDCFESWKEEAELAGFQDTPRISEVLAKYDEFKKQKERIENNADRQFKTASRIMDSDRPSGSSLTTSISQMQVLSESTIDHISEQAYMILDGLDKKKVSMIEMDTKILEQVLNIAITDEKNILDPSKKNNTRLRSEKWRETAIEFERVVHSLQSSLKDAYFAQKRTRDLVSNKIERLQEEIVRRNARANDIEECIVALLALDNKPRNERDWADKINNLNKYKSVINELGRGFNLSDVSEIAKTSLAIQHFRESTLQPIKMQWADKPWIDNMTNDTSITKAKASIDQHLQQHPHTPYKEYIASMSAILSEQIEVNVDNVLREIVIFSDIYRVRLQDKRYFYAIGVMGSPELHAIEDDNDLQADPADLTKPNLITDSPVVSNELSELSRSLLSHIKEQAAVGKPKATELLLYLLSAIDICKTERMDDPILSFAACTHFVNITLQNFGETLKVLSPTLFESFQKWSWDTQVNNLLSNWPRKPRNTDEYRKKQNRNDARKLVSSFAVNSIVLKDEINDQWTQLTSNLQTAIIQGVLKKPDTSNGKRNIIQDAEPEALILVRTINGWKFGALIDNRDGTGTPDGVTTNANTPIFYRKPQ